MTNANRNLPKSWRWRGVRTSDIGRRYESSTIRVMRKAIEVSNWLAMKSIPKIVENHCGSSESTQSMDMKVTVNPQNRMPGPDRKVILACATAGPSRSSAADHRLKNHDRNSHPPK